MLAGIKRTIAYVYVDEATGKTMGIYHGSTLNHLRRLKRLQDQYDLEVEMYGEAYPPTIANLEYCKQEKHADIPPFEVGPCIKPKAVKFTRRAPPYGTEDDLIADICSPCMYTRISAMSRVYARSDAVIEALIKAMRMDEQDEIYRNDKKVKKDKAPSEKQLERMTPTDRSFWKDRRGDGVIMALRTFSKFATRDDVKVNTFTLNILEQQNAISMIKREAVRILIMFDGHPEYALSILQSSRDIPKLLGCLEGLLDSESNLVTKERLPHVISTIPSIRNVAYESLKNMDLSDCKEALKAIVRNSTFKNVHIHSKINVGKLFKNANIPYHDPVAKAIADDPKEDMGVRNAFGRMYV